MLVTLISPFKQEKNVSTEFETSWRARALTNAHSKCSTNTFYHTYKTALMKYAKTVVARHTNMLLWKMHSFCWWWGGKTFLPCDKCNPTFCGGGSLHQHGNQLPSTTSLLFWMLPVFLSFCLVALLLPWPFSQLRNIQILTIGQFQLLGAIKKVWLLNYWW